MLQYGDLFAIVLVISALLAIHFENVTHAIISFGIMFAVLSALYFSLNAQFAAVFQLMLAAGTIAVFFLAGEMLSSKKSKTQELRSKVLGAIVALGLSVPSFIFSIEKGMPVWSHELSFPSALWEYRALDVIAQGVVILMLAIGAIMVLKEQKKRMKED
jgi:NADH:ubiquinone oxidoreductase subunit 6 (subunit J)